MTRVLPLPFTSAPYVVLDSVHEAIQSPVVFLLNGAGYNEHCEIVVIDNDHTAFTLSEQEIFDATAEWAAQILEHREKDTPADRVLAALDVRAECWEFLTLPPEFVEEVFNICLEVKTREC